MTIIPPYLEPGDTIGITCPAGYMPLDKISRCIEQLQEWGFHVVAGRTIGNDTGNYFSGNDTERLQELQSMLDDRSINAVLFGRGGYGMSRIIEQLSFKKFRKRPKWLIGYSDITVLHNHLLNKYGIASIHGPMAGAFNEFDTALPYQNALFNAIMGKKAVFECPGYELNRKGEASGMLLGGNLTLLSHIIGTPSDFETKNRILFIEDTGEYLYNIDRMLYQLKRSGKFNGLSGLIVGGFTEMKDTVRPFGKTVEQIILDVVQDFDFPVCFHFPVSHTKENLALKQGVPYKLKVTGKKTSLREL